MAKGKVMEPELQFKDYLEFATILHKIKYDINIFEILGCERNEARHSCILAWLMNKEGEHKFSYHFIKQFISIASDVEIKDTDTIFIDTEKVTDDNKRLDIFITINNSIVVVIENKLDSADADEQLINYKNYIEKNYTSYKKVFIYLTIDGEAPRFNKENNAEWKLYSYKEVLTLINDLYTINKDDMENKIQCLIEDYLVVLLRISQLDVEEALVKLYKRYNKEIDELLNIKTKLKNANNDKLIEAVNELLITEKTIVDIDDLKDYVVFKDKKGEIFSKENAIFSARLKASGKKVEICLDIDSSTLSDDQKNKLKGLYTRFRYKFSDEKDPKIQESASSNKVKIKGLMKSELDINDTLAIWTITREINSSATLKKVTTTMKTIIDKFNELKFNLK